LVQLQREDVDGAAQTLASTTSIAASNAFQLLFFDLDLMNSLVQLYQASGDQARTRQTLQWLAQIRATPDDFLALAQNQQNDHKGELAAKNCWLAYDRLVKQWVRPYDSRLGAVASCLAQSPQTDAQIEKRIHRSGSGTIPQLLLGQIMRIRSQPERAEEALLFAAQSGSEESAPHYYLGELYLTLNRQADAEKELRLAADLNAHESLPLLSLGRMYENNHNMAAAQEAYQMAVERTPGSEDAQLALANFYLKTQQYQDAAPHFAAVQQINARALSYPRIDLISGISGAALSETAQEGFIKGSVCEINGDREISIFMHPVSWAKYDLRLPTRKPGEDIGLSVKIGLLPGSWNMDGDGVTFKVSLAASNTDQKIFSKYIDPKKNVSDRRWDPVNINLNEFAGQNITLTLSTDGGDAGDIQYDWACWGEPGIVVEKSRP
jgi:tetratricopeptide (TPR) repeat protein